MKTRRLADNSMLHHNEAGAVQTIDLGKGVVLHVCRGIAGEGFAHHVIEDGNRQIEKFGRCVFMVDAYDARMMTTEFRERMMAWFRSRERVAFVHILIRSRLLEMAMNVANLVLRAPVATIYSKVGDWEAAGRREIKEFKRRPLKLPADISIPGLSNDAPG